MANMISHNVLPLSKTDELFIQANLCVCFYPFLGGLVAEVQGSGVPVYSNISISQRGSVICALYHAASAEPGNTQAVCLCS